MISKALVWACGDIICAKDGSISLTRVAACTAHLLAAAFFIYYNLAQPFNEVLWLTYLGFATGHAVWDKTSAMIKDSKDKKIV